MNNLPTPSVRVNPWQKVLMCLALATACFVVYWPVLHHGIIYYDDPQYVTDNPHVLSGLKSENLHWAMTGICAANWHPLTMMSHMLDAQLYGADYGKHHLTSLVLHSVNAILLFLLLGSMTLAFWRSAFVAALFALHPLHVESVAWLAERKDVLSGFFFMLTLLVYSKYAQLKARIAHKKLGDTQIATHTSGLPLTFHASRITHHASPLYALALLTFALGLMSKPMLVTLPFVLLLLDIWPLDRLKLEKPSGSKSLVPLLIEKLPFFALAIGSSMATVYAQRAGGALDSLQSVPLGWRLANGMISYLTYVGQTFWPTRLAILYPYPLNPSSKAAISALLLAVVTVTAFLWAKRALWFTIGWFWYLGMLVPVIGLVQVGDQAHADRYTYLPSIGIFIVVTWGAAQLMAQIFSRLIRKSPTSEGSAKSRRVKPSPRQPALTPANVPLSARALVFGLSVFLLVVVGYSARSQVRYWRTGFALFQHAAEVTRDNYVAYSGLGIAALYEQKYSTAMTNLFRALETAGPYGATGPIKYYLGAALQMQGQGLKALKYFEEAKVGPDLEPARKCRLGICLAEAGRLDEAEKYVREAMAEDPEKAEFQVAMAGLLQMQHHTSEAESLYRKIITEHADYAPAHSEYGNFLMLLNRAAEAEAQYAAAITNRTTDAGLRRSLATALSKQGKSAEALQQLREALKQEPNDPQINFEVAEILTDQGKKQEAIAHYNKAIEANPEFVFALNNLAWLLATDPDDQIRNGHRAVELAERACRVTNSKYAFLIGTLAAAYAEAGRFPEAVAAAERACDTARADNQEQIAERNEQLLVLYRARKPFHETK